LNSSKEHHEADLRAEKAVKKLERRYDNQVMITAPIYEILGWQNIHLGIQSKSVSSATNTLAKRSKLSAIQKAGSHLDPKACNPSREAALSIFAVCSR
jgi:hypothetical protein